MKIGFKEVDESEQKIYKAAYRFNRGFSKVLLGAYCLAVVGCLAGAAYFALTEGKDGGDYNRCFTLLSVAGAITAALVLVLLLLWLITYIRKKSIIVSPELNNTENRGQYSLRFVLSVMRAKAGLFHRIC